VESLILGSLLFASLIGSPRIGESANPIGAILGAAVMPGQNPRPTLALQLSVRALPAPRGAEDLNDEITSFGVLDDSGGLVIAYYVLRQDGLLHDLRVRAFDKHMRTWRYARFESIGSVLHVVRGRGYLYLGGHSSPSAAPTLVLNDQLQRRQLLDGWLKLVLPDGRLIFERSMRHFQATHAGVLAIYDPESNAERTFYPSPALSNDRGFEAAGPGSAIDRDISDVKLSGPHSIQFTVVTQTMKLSPDRAVPDGPERRLSVVCDVETRGPTCESRTER